MLEVQGLSVRFGGLQAVRSVDFRAEAGAITARLGPNGAGKTTIFAMLAGFVWPSAGLVRFGGTDITEWVPERIALAGMVRTFQVTQPFAGLSVAENIRVGAYLAACGPARGGGAGAGGGDAARAGGDAGPRWRGTPRRCCKTGG